MKCNKCGYEAETEFKFCPGCGQEAQESSEPVCGNQAPVYEAPAVNPIMQRLSYMFRDNLFLTLCILISASLLFNVAGTNFPVIQILLTIFLWLIYSQARRGAVNTGYMRYLSGTVFAQYVINWVLVGILAFLGFVVVVFSAVASGSEFMDYIAYALSEYSNELSGLTELLVSGASFIGMLVGVILILAAGVVAIINAFGYRSMHKLAQSLYMSAGTGNFIVAKRNAAQVWMLVFGIFSGISALSAISVSALSFFSSGCLAAAYIVSYLLVKKYFSDCNC